ncbi:MAG: hypothetical protein V2I46_00950 [Bacteroides sp.]|jgi:hypothetical protein|nr:hypothetical protein [Bacteroides sp.]
MKNHIITSIFAFFLMGMSAFAAQSYPEEYLGLPGDNLNLYAVMNVFQESETIEAFERKLNDPEAVVNNLDLNNDGYVDYIMVNDYQYENGTVHNIVLSVALNQNETQDVAVFAIEKKRDGSVIVQLIGDEALYGKNYIIEPQYAETPNPAYRGRVVSSQPTVVRTTYYEVASWPLIVYISRPSYVVWRTRWYWGYYPSYWSPWNVHYYHYYYGYHYHWHNHYYSHYRPWRHYRVNHYHNYYYTSVRRYSPLVVVNINRGVYKDTYSRPETRREGEALYAHRTSNSGRVAGSGRSGNTVNNRSGAATTREAAVNTPRDARGEREASTSSSVRSAERSQTNASRREAATAPARQTVRTQNERKNAPAEAAPAAPAQRSQAPVRAATRPASSQRDNGNRTSPAVSNRRSSTPNRSAVQQSSGQPSSSNRSTPARVSTRRASEAPRVQQAEPARNNRSSAPRVSSSPSRSNRSSGTVRNSGGSNNRPSGTVRSTSSRTNRSSGTVRSSGGSSRSSGSVRSNSSRSNRSSGTVRSSGSSSSKSSKNNERSRR